ncbi:MAG: tRNA-dihydrouridine synthase family protein [Bacteroidales bacterium]|nr:tRNA-dihydrouridine synthase family protein [Bacteroidales bacterium]
MNDKILLAPIQGITDYVFRNVFLKYFSGVDYMYSPFLRLDKDNNLRNSKIRDILPENNKINNMIPQIMTNSSDGLIFLCNFLGDKGYNEINWNLGCPFPMVANRKLGSGLLPFHHEIGKILDESMPKLNLKLSIKMRLGYENPNDINDILPILEKYPLSEIIIHPRTAKQMYKGEVNLEAFENSLQLTKHNISYNGNINTVDDFKYLKERFPQINSWMLGRGIVSNPFLASDIKNENICNNKRNQFKLFHTELSETYLNLQSGNSHFINKMKGFWEYFSLSFTNRHKVYKRIKKAKTQADYYAAANYNFNNEKWCY